MKNRNNDIHNELREMNSFLADHDPVHDLVVPEGYFEALENEILSKTVLSEKKGKIVRLSVLKYVLGIAATAAVIFIGMKLFNRGNDLEFETQLASMNKAELQSYINNQIASISAEEFHNYIDENIRDIDAGLFAETEYIDDEVTQKQLIENVNLEILSDNDNGETTEPLLDEEMIDGIDDDVIEQMLMDESMYDDFAL